MYIQLRKSHSNDCFVCMCFPFSGYGYQLDEYWESNKEDPFITTVQTETANWTTHLILDVYKSHFPWGNYL